MLWGEIRLCTHRGATKKGLEYINSYVSPVWCLVYQKKKIYKEIYKKQYFA